MKKMVLLVVGIMCCGMMYAQKYLPVEITADGDVIVCQQQPMIATDNMIIRNHTDESFFISIEGFHTKDGFVKVGEVGVMSKSQIVLQTKYKNRLKMFPKFYFKIIGLSPKLVSAMVDRQDLLFSVLELEKQSVPSAAAQPTPNSSVEIDAQLVKLKGWLDAGFITQEEYNAKREELIGF